MFDITDLLAGIILVVMTILAIIGVFAIADHVKNGAMPNTYNYQCEEIVTDYPAWQGLQRCRPINEVCPDYGELFEDGWCYPD